MSIVLREVVLTIIFSVFSVLLVLEFLKGTHRLFPENHFLRIVLLLRGEGVERRHKYVLFFEILPASNDRDDNMVGK